MKHQVVTRLPTVSVGHKTLSEWSALFRHFLEGIDLQFDSGHRLDHVERVVINALKLANEERGVIYEVLVPAAWLHDCVPISKHSKQRPQASRLSADRAQALLQELNYPTEYQEAIGHAIRAHSYSAEITPTTLEAKIVQDADRLDSLGAIGIARVFLVGGQLENSIYPPHEPFNPARELDERRYIVDHFFSKLLNLASSFHTDAGRREAERRTQYMRRYVDQLVDEVGGD
jgi:uncharacterized protein